MSRYNRIPRLNKSKSADSQNVNEQNIITYFTPIPITNDLYKWVAPSKGVIKNFTIDVDRVVMDEQALIHIIVNREKKYDVSISEGTSVLLSNLNVNLGDVIQLKVIDNELNQVSTSFIFKRR